MEYTFNDKKRRIIIDKIKYDYFFKMAITDYSDNIIDDENIIVVFLRKKLFGYSRQIHMFLPLNIHNKIKLNKVLNKDYTEHLQSDIGDDVLFLLYNEKEHIFYDNQTLINCIESIIMIQKISGK